MIQNNPDHPITRIRTAVQGVKNMREDIGEINETYEMIENAKWITDDVRHSMLGNLGEMREGATRCIAHIAQEYALNRKSSSNGAPAKPAKAEETEKKEQPFVPRQEEESEEVKRMKREQQDYTPPPSDTPYMSVNPEEVTDEIRKQRLLEIEKLIRNPPQIMANIFINLPPKTMHDGLTIYELCDMAGIGNLVIEGEEVVVPNSRRLISILQKEGDWHQYNCKLNDHGVQSLMESGLSLNNLPKNRMQKMWFKYDLDSMIRSLITVKLDPEKNYTDNKIARELGFSRTNLKHKIRPAMHEKGWFYVEANKTWTKQKPQDVPEMDFDAHRVWS